MVEETTSRSRLIKFIHSIAKDGIIQITYTKNEEKDERARARERVRNG